MGDILAELPPLNIGAGALVTLIVLLVLFGRLPSPKAHQDVIDQRNKAMELADKWQKVATEQGMTLNRILDSVENINDVVTAIQTGLSQAPGGGQQR